MRVGIVGAGILGLAVARRITEVTPTVQVTVVEKEAAPARHQSSHNSGVVHAGVYYAPGSLKAVLCRRGAGLLREFCAAHELPYLECGKVIVARDETELPRLAAIEDRARANAVPGLRRLSARELPDFEPHVRGRAALHSPRTAVTDFAAVARALGSELERSGGDVRFGFQVSRIDRVRGEIRITSRTGETVACDRLVVCAGLQSDRVARLAGDGPNPIIVPFRGEYLRLVAERSHLVRGLVYPVPDPGLPFLGVHFTRRVDGGVDLGPSAVLALAREGYRRRDLTPADVGDLMRAPALRRLIRRHWRTGVRELPAAFSRRAFVAAARTFVPELRARDVRPAPAGVRAQALDPDGSLVDDFRLSRRDGMLLVRNAPSPAATASLAIAEHLVTGLELG